MWIQDRFEDGRRVAERTFNDGRKVAERTLQDGGKVAERSWLDSRKIAGRAYDEGRQVAGRTYIDGRREAEHRLQQARQARREAERRLDEGRHAVADRIEDGRSFFRPRLADGRKAIGEGRQLIRDRFGARAPTVEAGVVAGAVIWPALLLAAGTGVAYFCWSQYVRGRDARQARSLDEAGGAGPLISEPEMVMAHNAAPRTQGHEAVDPADAELVEPAEALMMHTPLDDTPPEGASINAMKGAPRAAILKRRTAQPAKATTDAKALAAAASAAQASRPTALDESLAVQGAASASKRQSPNGATPPVDKPKRKGGPTVM